ARYSDREQPIERGAAVRSGYREDSAAGDAGADGADAEVEGAEVAPWLLLVTSISRCSVVLFADVVAVNEILVAEVEFAVVDHGVRPDLAGVFALIGLRVEFEPAMLFPTFGRGFDQHHFAFVFAETVEAVVGVSDGAFAER